MIYNSDQENLLDFKRNIINVQNEDKRSSLYQWLFITIFGTYYGTSIFMENVKMNNIGFAPFFILLIIGSIFNYYSYMNTLILAENNNIKSYKELLNIIKFPIINKVLPFLFTFMLITKIMITLIIINNSIASIVNVYIVDNNSIFNKYSLIYITFVLGSTIPFLLTKKIISLRIFSIIGIIGFFIAIIFVYSRFFIINTTRPSIKQYFELNIKNIPNTWFFILSSSAFHTNLLTIKNELKLVNDMKFKIVIIISIAIIVLMVSLFNIPVFVLFKTVPKFMINNLVNDYESSSFPKDVFFILFNITLIFISVITLMYSFHPLKKIFLKNFKKLKYDKMSIAEYTLISIILVFSLFLLGGFFIIGDIMFSKIQNFNIAFIGPLIFGIVPSYFNYISSRNNIDILILIMFLIMYLINIYFYFF